jgi:chromosome segregation ATPase
MAFENRIIASMNNPNAADAWREAKFQHHWKMFHADRAADLEDEIEKLVGNIQHYQTTAQRAQHELKASREENRALHEELGKAHELSENALTTMQAYCGAYFDQRVLTADAEKRAFRNAMFLFAFVALQAIGGWGELLLRLS